MATKKVVKKMETKTVAKKVGVKTAIKKTSIPKKTLSPVKELVYADDESSFWLADGQILNSLVALHEALSNMEKAVYAHHVTSEKNDFAQWIETVLDDSDCAQALKSAKTPASAKTVVVKYLKLYRL